MLKKILLLLPLLLLPLLVNAASVTLAWDASCDPGIAGYRVYYNNGGLPSTNAYGGYTNDCNIYIPPTINVYHGAYNNSVVSLGYTNAIVTISNLVNGVTYYFVVTMFGTNGMESPFSFEIAYTVPFPRPAAPQSLRLAYLPIPMGVLCLGAVAIRRKLRT